MITIVAHRGAPQREHENTVKSFLAAIELGADMVELDIRKTGDGVLVVFHDPYFSRSGRRTPVNRTSYRDLNRRAAKKKFHIPTVEEAFSSLSGRTKLDIELKEPGYEDSVVALAAQYFDMKDFVCTSFDPKIVAAVNAASPSCTTGLILSGEESLAFCDRTLAGVVAPDHKLFAAHREFFSAAKNQGKKIAVWTVDGTAALSQLLVDPLVDAIITNRPDRAVALRKKLSNV